ncbi:MAG: hypothetical protein NY202_02710 [Mollicutes bacterium UO1]
MNRKVIKYAKCKGCGEVNFIPEQTKSLKCYFCNNFETITTDQELEVKNEKVVQEMIKHLLPTETPNIIFPASNMFRGSVCPG